MKKLLLLLWGTSGPDGCIVMPAKAGIQALNKLLKIRLNAWIPAFAGMTTWMVPFLCLSGFGVSWANAAVRVVTTSEDLASIARMIGGEEVRVESLSSGDQDIHLVEPRPSMVVKVSRADLIVRNGMDLDMWMDSLIAAARNKNIIFGAPGYVDVSAGISKLQVPEGRVDASMGDIHIYGNPHFWLDPKNGLKIADNIRDGLIRVDPNQAALFRANYETFSQKLSGKMEEWEDRMKPLSGLTLVTYHNSWIYFAGRFHLDIVGNVEPKPGIPPTPSHLASLIDTIKARGVKVILVDTFFPLSGPKKLERETGVAVVVVPSSVGGTPEAKDTFSLFDTVIERLVQEAGK